MCMSFYENMQFIALHLTKVVECGREQDYNEALHTSGGLMLCRFILLRTHSLRN